MKTKSLSAFCVLALLLAGCGGGDSSSGGEESLAQEREAVECIDISESTVNNTCDFSVVFRAFSGADNTPITIASRSSAQLVGLGNGFVTISFGACRAPFTPNSLDSGFECL